MIKYVLYPEALAAFTRGELVFAIRPYDFDHVPPWNGLEDAQLFKIVDSRAALESLENDGKI